MNKNTLALKKTNASLVYVSNKANLTEFKTSLDTVQQAIARKVSRA